MKWKRWLSMALVCVMTLGCFGGSALAAGADDAALQAVTLKVKNVLGLDTAEFDDFEGSSSEDVLLGRRWRLNWSGDGVSLTITCDDSGKIYSYNRMDSVDDVIEPVRYNGGRLNIPSLPVGDAEVARTAARDFLGKVLEAGLETVELEGETKPSLRQTSFRFSGEILLNGEHSPISCSVTVRAKDHVVTGFRRTDERSGYQGTIPGPDTAVSVAQAKRLLRAGVTMEPYYVLGEDGVTATVQYLASWGNDLYVDGKTGELVDLTELRAHLWEQGYQVTNKFFASDAAAPEASEMAGGATLTDTELEGAAKLAGALDKEILDKAVRNAWPELGLDNYTLAGADYWVNELPQTDEEIAAGAAKEYEVTCRLSYGLQLNESVATKTVKVNAKTGELLTVRGWRPYEEGTALTIRRATAERTARAALELYAKEHAGVMEVYSVNEPGEYGTQFSFTFCQKENGYFYRGNSYTVVVDAVDGSVSGLSGSFDENVTLVKPKKAVTADQALTAYVEALEARYGYVEVPTAVSLLEKPVRALFEDSMYDYVLTLRPGYVLTQGERYVESVDAESGEAVLSPEADQATYAITYDDVAGTWVETAANTLAKYDVGFTGGSLKGSAQLTQLDMLTLLASVDGWQFDPQNASKDELDSFYSHCYYLGLVTPATRDEDKAVTRGELIRTLLDAAGYQRIAALKGIFRCDFSDAGSIPEGDYGYAALAQGLGLVRGGSDGAYAAGRGATRAEAVTLLYQYMK